MDYVSNAQLQYKQVQNAGGDSSYEQNGLKLNKGFFKLRATENRVTAVKVRMDSNTEGAQEQV